MKSQCRASDCRKSQEKDYMHLLKMLTFTYLHSCFRIHILTSVHTSETKFNSTSVCLWIFFLILLHSWPQYAWCCWFRPSHVYRSRLVSSWSPRWPYPFYRRFTYFPSCCKPDWSLSVLAHLTRPLGVNPKFRIAGTGSGRWVELTGRESSRGVSLSLCVMPRRRVPSLTKMYVERLCTPFNSTSSHSLPRAPSFFFGSG